MNFDLDTRRVRMGVGELAEFSLGPRDAGEGASGVWPEYCKVTFP